MNNNQKNGSIDLVLKKNYSMLFKIWSWNWTRKKKVAEKIIKDAINDYVYEYITPHNYDRGKVYQSIKEMILKGKSA